MTLSGKTLQVCYPHERLVRNLFYGLIVLILAYGYLVASLIFNAVDRQEMADDITGLTSTVATLESEYVALSGRVTLELAHNLGFADTANRTGFAYQAAPEWNESL